MQREPSSNELHPAFRHPSPYARKVRIALLEKGVPFTLKTEVPWHEATETKLHNPLEKLPVLIPDDGDEQVGQRLPQQV